MRLLRSISWLLAVVVMGCKSVPSSHDAFTRETTVITGQHALVVQATQRAMTDLHLEIERQSQLNDGTWLIIAHASARPEEPGSILVEVKETGADDVTVALRRHRPAQPDAQVMTSELFFATIRKLLET